MQDTYADGQKLKGNDFEEKSNECNKQQNYSIFKPVRAYRHHVT